MEDNEEPAVIISESMEADEELSEVDEVESKMEEERKTFVGSEQGQ